MKDSFIVKVLSKLIAPWWRFQLREFWPIQTRIDHARAGSLWQSLLKAYKAEYLHGFGSFIGEASFGGAPCFPHGPYGIFISSAARIGWDAVIFHHVTIGSNKLPGSKGAWAPVIRNGVYIGVGAMIIGHVRVGDNCRIGANAVVVRDISANTVVVAQPARELHRDSTMDNRFRYQRSSAGLAL